MEVPEQYLTIQRLGLLPAENALNKYNSLKIPLVSTEHPPKPRAMRRAQSEAAILTSRPNPSGSGPTAAATLARSPERDIRQSSQDVVGLTADRSPAVGIKGSPARVTAVKPVGVEPAEDFFCSITHQVSLFGFTCRLLVYCLMLY